MQVLDESILNNVVLHVTQLDAEVVQVKQLLLQVAQMATPLS